MSGVYIHGMEMPTSCKECVFKSVTGVDRWKCRVLNAEFMSWYVGWGGEETRREDCPLIAVPDHGRLIDADAFIKDECNNCDGACEALPCDCLNCKSDCRCEFIVDLADATTIIPADPADKEGK